MEPDGLTLGIDIGGTSVKVALLDGDRERWVGKSAPYAKPGVEELSHAVRGLIRDAENAATAARISVIGICAPGLRDASGIVTRAVNVPGLVGVSPAKLIGQCAPELAGSLLVESTDSHAAAVDYWHANPGPGRLLALSMGTGIGASVLDAHGNGGPTPLLVTGRGPGQIGQLDVGEGAAADQPVGPDGGRGTLEAYLGLPALRATFGEEPGARVAALQNGRLRASEWPLRALVRALRIAHAIYLPDRIVLLGGVGIRLRSHVEEVRAAVADGLTTLARPGWVMACGENDFHAARGAARLARSSLAEGEAPGGR